VILCEMFCCKMRKVLVIHIFKSCSSYLTLQLPFFYNSVLELVYCVEVDSGRSSKTDDKLRFASIFTPKADGRRGWGGGVNISNVENLKIGLMNCRRNPTDITYKYK
jgi:hypothetical protein